MNKKILVIIGLLSVLGLGLFLLLTRSGGGESVVPVQKKQSAVRPFEELPEEDRPEIDLGMSTDGRDFLLKVSQIKNFTSVEYDLSYLVEGSIQGFNSTIALQPGETSFEREFYRGTCSSGVCRPEKGEPKKGTLTLYFRGDKDYKYLKDFSIETEAGKYRVVME